MTSPYKGVFSLFLAHLVTDIYMPVITAILPLFISVFGFSHFMAGLLVTAFNLTSSMTQPVFGWLSDEKGFEVHVSSSIMISAVFISLMGIIGNYPLLLFCAAMAAIGHACFHPNALSQVSRMAVDTNRGRITSIFVVGGNIGACTRPAHGGRGRIPSRIKRASPARHTGCHHGRGLTANHPACQQKEECST